MAVGFVASASSGSQASVASFNIGTLGTSARAGIVFVAIHNSATDIISGVTWNGTSMTLIGKATDSDTEPGVVKCYFLDNVTNGTITVSRTNNTVVTVGYAASISGTALEVFQFITRAAQTTNTNADTSATGVAGTGGGLASVSDGYPGSDSMRFATGYTGASTPIAAGTGSTSLQLLDSTALGSRFVRESTAGQGARNVGFADSSDDWAAVYVAVREKAVISEPTAGSLTLTGDTPTVVATDNKTSLPTAASLTLTGATPAVVVPAMSWGDWSSTYSNAASDAVLVEPTAAALTLTGATPAVTAPAVSLPTAAVLTLAGDTPVVAATNNVTTQPTAASLTLTGDTPVVTAPAVSLPTAAALALTGSTPVVALPIVSAPTTGALALTGGTPSVQTPVLAQPTAGSLALTGATPAVATPVVSLPTAASLTLAGATPDVSAIASVTALPTAASLVIAGAVPDVSAGASINPQPTAASLILAGDTPAVATSDNKVALPTAAALTLAGATPDVALPVVSQPTAAELALAFGTPAVAVTNNIYVTPGPLGLVLTGAVPTVTGGVVGGGKAGRGGPRQLPNLPDPDADEAYLLALGVL